MEEQREESEFVGDCRELMEEDAAGKGLSLSSKTQTLGCEDANTVEVSDSGVCDVSGTHENPNDGGSATEDSNMDHSVSDEKQVKVHVGSVEDKVHKTFSSDDVERSDAGTVAVKPVDEGEGSEICDDVQRVSKTVKLVDVEMNDETAKSEVKSRNGESHESAGEEETVTSGGNEVTDEKAKCDVEDNSGACDGETLSVAEDKADQDKESAKKSEEDYNKMDVDSKKVNEETVALNEQGTWGSETKDAEHSESAPVPEESTQLIKGDGNKGNPGTVSEVSSAADTCREEERTNVNQKEENGEAMEIDHAADKQLEKDVKVGGVLDNAGNESADAIIFFPNTNQKARNDLQNSMKRGANTKPIPTDLIIEIFSRLPAKSVGRFRSLSKQWCSILSRQDFTELFRSKSSARPRLLFAVERKGVWSFFSSPQSSSSLVVAADSHAVFREDVSRFTCSYASGLFYFRDMWIPRVGTVSLVCNPITGQYVSLPEGDMYRKSRGFIGFDPIEKQFKVLAEAYPFCSQRDHHEILTLGIGELSWRKKNIDCPQYDHSLCEGICINGILYYLVDNFSDLPGNIVRFDLRSEEFTFVVAECFSDPTTTKLINYKGKLGGIDCNYAEAGGRYTLELCLWVLEDVERQEWSKCVYTLPENKLIDDPCNVSVAGVTATGEIVLATDYTCKPFYVFYFNPERNTLRSVEIQGFGANLEALKYRGRVYTFVDHVEDLNADDSKQLKSSITASRVKHLCSNCKEQEKRERQ